MLTALITGVEGDKWFRLFDKVFAERNLLAAYQQVASKRGAPGVDHVTVDEFGRQLPEHLWQLSDALKDGTYQPQAIRRVHIPKPGTNETRPLGVPTVRDRIVQAAVVNVIEPIFDCRFAEHSYGFRPGRRCRDALRRVDQLLKAGYVHVVDADLKVNRPEGWVRIDRRRAAELGVSVQDVARTLQLAYGGQRFGYFLKNDRQYDVTGQVERGERNEPGDLAALFVRARSGAMISLDNLVKLEERVGPAAIYRFNRFTSATISAGLAPGRTVGDGVEALDEIAARTLPEGIRTSLAGQSRDMNAIIKFLLQSGQPAGTSSTYIYTLERAWTKADLTPATCWDLKSLQAAQ